MTNNPLKTLGIDPALLRKVDAETARTLLRAVSQALMKVSHPDQETGDRNRFEAVQTATQALKDDELFADALADLIKPRSDQISKLSTDNRKLRQLVTHHEKRARKFALAGLSAQLTVRSRGPFQLHIVDVVRSDLRKISFFKPDPSAFVLMEMDESGQLHMTRNNVKKPSGRHLVGTIAQKEDIKQLMRDCQPDRSDLLQNGGRSQRIGITQESTDDAPIGANRILVKNATPILRRLRPEIQSGANLFTGLSIEGEDYLYFEGRLHNPPHARSL